MSNPITMKLGPTDEIEVQRKDNGSVTFTGTSTDKDQAIQMLRLAWNAAVPTTRAKKPTKKKGS